MEEKVYKTVGMVSLGCAKNQVDAEVMLGLLKREGLTVVQDPAKAEVIVINTCGFIGPAKEESIQAILEHAPYKEHGVCKALVVTGCLAERYAQELQTEMPEVDAVVGTANYTGILSILQEVSEGARRHYTGDVDRRLTEDLPRVISTGTRTAYLKIAEGCDNHCSYCIIPALRGAYRSRPLTGLVLEAQQLAAQGIQELIIIAQDLPFLQAPLVRVFRWIEVKWENWQQRRKR
jgi:ribosomal protein S12 methylthiotransferase